MLRYIRIMFTAAIALVLATGCIKEDFDDCDNVTIYFQYLADGDKDVLYQYMDKVDLYVFDEGGHILGVGTYNQDELATFSAKPSFKLQPGRRYKVVAVGNAYDATQVVNVTATSFDDIFLQSPNWGDETEDVVTNHDHNYLGQHEFTMPSQEDVMYRDTVTLYSAHVNVDVRIYGLPAPTRQQDASIPYQLSIENSNAQCSFNNEINTDASQKGTIYPELVYDAENQCYRTQDLALFRMDDHGDVTADCCEHTLVLRDLTAGEDAAPLISGNLYNYITRNDAIEESVTLQEATLPIEIQFHGLNAEIVVPDWVIVDGKPEWN